MKEVSGERQADKICLKLSGRIDSNNAGDAEAALREIIGQKADLPIVIDADELEYISSAGLRIILRFRKMQSDITLTNVNTDVYDILDMTGFTEMLKVEKAYRVVSVEGCEVIGRGANGTLYRIDMDNVVKVYNNANALDEIQHEREVARTALVLGIPTAISYDVVRVGDSYGSVFELLNAESFSEILAEKPEKLDWCADEYVKLLKKIHGTLVPAGSLPDIKDTVLEWARFMQDYLPKEYGDKLLALVEAVPHNDHMIHGDYHTKNVELVDDEVLLIDMDTLAIGHPVFELASMYNAFIGYYENDPDAILEFQGFDMETSKKFWKKSLSLYLCTNDEKTIQSVEDKARIIGYARMIRRAIRRGKLETEAGKAEIEIWTKKLMDLLDLTDTLLFDTGDEIEVEAVRSNLDKVIGFIDSHLEAVDCPMKVQMQIDLAVEEIFVNIASYAYEQGEGTAIVRIQVTRDPITAIITFIDHGTPYDPLAKQDPDVTLSAQERQIGGLGIFLVKKTMDDVTYEYRDGQNILSMKKIL